MAAPGRKPKGETAASSAQRKRDFDARMRNEHGQVPGAPKRTPVNIYLSEAARSVLAKYRETRKLLNAGPVLDAELVEFALKAFGQQRLGPNEPQEAQVAADEAATLLELNVSKFRRDAEELKRLKLVMRCIEERQASDVMDQLQEAHVLSRSLLVYLMAQRLAKALPECRSDADRMYLLHEELSDYFEQIGRDVYFKSKY